MQTTVFNMHIQCVRHLQIQCNISSEELVALTMWPWMTPIGAWCHTNTSCYVGFKFPFKLSRNMIYPVILAQVFLEENLTFVIPFELFSLSCVLFRIGIVTVVFIYEPCMKATSSKTRQAYVPPCDILSWTYVH